MKRTNTVTKLISVVLFVGLAIYLGIYVYQSYNNPFTTAPAIQITAEESFSSAGIIIRDESIVASGHNIVASMVEDGEKVSDGQLFLVAYSSEEARARDEKVRQIQEEIAQLETYLSSGNTADRATQLDGKIKDGIFSLNYARQTGNLSGVEAGVISVRALVFSSDAAGTDARLDSLHQQLAQLGGESASDTTPIYAERSGVYSSYVDGFEDLSSEMLVDITAEDIASLTAQRRETAPGSGKLIEGIRWYYATTVSAEQASQLKDLQGEGRELTVSLSDGDGHAAAVPMAVHQIHPDDGGSAVAVFSSTTALAETLRLRQVEADIIYEHYEGIRVPKDALRIDDEGNTYVFTVTGVTAEQKYVEVLYELEDYYLAVPDLERTPSAAAIRVGNTIIVRGRDLYDGKVISK